MAETTSNTTEYLHCVLCLLLIGTLLLHTTKKVHFTDEEAKKENVHLLRL